MFRQGPFHRKALRPRLPFSQMSGFPLPPSPQENAGFQGSSYPPYNIARHHPRRPPHFFPPDRLQIPRHHEGSALQFPRQASQFSDLRNTFDSKMSFPHNRPRLYPPSPHSDPQCSMEQASAHIPRHRQSLCLSSSPFHLSSLHFHYLTGNDSTALPSHSRKARNALLSFSQKVHTDRLQNPHHCCGHISHTPEVPVSGFPPTPR